MRPRITEGHKALAANVRHWREIRGIDTNMLARAVGWPLAMIEDIESAEQFDITLNDVDQLAEALAVQPFDQFVLPVFPVSAHGTDSGLSFKECFGLVV